MAKKAPLPDPFKAYLQTQRKYDLRIMRILEVTARDLRKRIAALDATRFSEQVRARQLKAVLASVLQTQRAMFLDIGDVIMAGKIDAANDALLDFDDLARVAFASLPEASAEELIRSFKHTAQSGIDSLYARTPRTLSSRLYNEAAFTSGKIEQLINVGLASGLSAKELARSVYQYVSPSAPGGASYVSMRLARTEINNAFHNRQIANLDAPGVEAGKWNLSGSHRVPDECNRYAETDAFGLGVGCFPVNKVPGKPHPHCLCYVTAVSVDPDQFANNVRQGKYDDDLRKRFNANMALVKQGTPLRAAPASPSKVPPAARPTKDLTSHFNNTVKVRGADGMKVREALENQGRFAPESMGKLTGFHEVEAKDLDRFEQEMGKSTLGVYLPTKRAIYAHPDVFSLRYARAFKDEVSSNWCSNCGKKATSIDSFTAHESGHHVAGFFTQNEPGRVEVWRAVFRELGLPNTRGKYSQDALQEWVDLHADTIAQKVSRYGATSAHELLAEVWHEYTLNPNARPHIKAIGRKIQTVSERLAKAEQ